jgi:hypothetical protein
LLAVLGVKGAERSGQWAKRSAGNRRVVICCGETRTEEVKRVSRSSRSSSGQAACDKIYSVRSRRRGQVLQKACEAAVSRELDTAIKRVEQRSRDIALPKRADAFSLEESSKDAHSAVHGWYVGAGLELQSDFNHIERCDDEATMC